MAESPWLALSKGGRDLGTSREEAGEPVVWVTGRSLQTPLGSCVGLSILLVALESPFAS
jgi:hypothetical protein